MAGGMKSFGLAQARRKDSRPRHHPKIASFQDPGQMGLLQDGSDDENRLGEALLLHSSRRCGRPCRLWHLPHIGHPSAQTMAADLGRAALQPVDPIAP